MSTRASPDSKKRAADFENYQEQFKQWQVGANQLKDQILGFGNRMDSLLARLPAHKKRETLQLLEYSLNLATKQVALTTLKELNHLTSNTSKSDVYEVAPNKKISITMMSGLTNVRI